MDLSNGPGEPDGVADRLALGPAPGPALEDVLGPADGPCVAGADVWALGAPGPGEASETGTLPACLADQPCTPSATPASPVRIRSPPPKRPIDSTPIRTPDHHALARHAACHVAGHSRSLGLSAGCAGQSAGPDTGAQEPADLGLADGVVDTMLRCESRDVTATPVKQEKQA